MRILLAHLVFMLPFFVFCQDGENSHLVQAAVNNAILEYEEQFKEPLFLHTGSEYVDYDLRVEGFPYFMEDYFSEGLVMLDGRVYDGVQMKYDVCKDIVVIEHYDGNGYLQELELISGRVDTFNIHGYLFFRVDERQKYGNQLDHGFYNLLYDGSVGVLSKRNKVYEETINGLQLDKKFVLKDKFFVVKDHQVYPVRNKRALLKVFKDKKRLLKKALKEGRISFKSDFEGALVFATKIYDGLATGS